MLREDCSIDQSVSVFESLEDKRDRWRQRRWERKCPSAPAVRVDLRLAAETELYWEPRLRVMTQSTKVALKPTCSCKDRGTTRGQSKCRECQQKSKSKKRGGETVSARGGLAYQPKSMTSHRYEVAMRGQTKSGECQPKLKLARG